MKIREIIRKIQIQIEGIPKELKMQKLAQEGLITYDDYCNYLENKIKKSMAKRRKQLKRKVIKYEDISGEYKLWDLFRYGC